MSNFLYAENISEAFSKLNSVEGAKIVSGCTAIADLPEISLCVRNIPELNTIEKKERFFDFGAATTLSKILNLGKQNLPTVLFEAMKTVANPNVRNMATIGGNICSRNFMNTLYSPLLALDAKITYLKKRESFSKIPIIPFFKAKNSSLARISEMHSFVKQTIPIAKISELPENTLITSIKIPLAEWNFSAFERFGPGNELGNDSGTFTFLASIESNQLFNVRIAFASNFLFRLPEIENKLFGAALPLEKSRIEEIVSEIQEKFDEECQKTPIKPLLRKQFLNLLRFYLTELK